MIGILFFIVIGIWFYVAARICSWIPKRMGLAWRFHNAVSLLAFPLVFTAPVADEIIGQWQFHRLCEREAKVILSPDWEIVKRAKKKSTPNATVGGAIIPINMQQAEYTDLDSGNIFLSYKAFHTHGGLLRRNFFGLGLSNSCWPDDFSSTLSLVSIDKLIQQGESK